MSVWSDMQDRSTGEIIRKEDLLREVTSEDLVYMLKQGIVHFQYHKKAKKGQPYDSGEVRDAWGTKNSGDITKVPHGGDCPPKNAGYTIYFDMVKGDWRAFMDNLVIGAEDHIYSFDEFIERTK